MDTMLARYLDGELTENEARAFQTLLETNRALAAELRELEGALDLFGSARCRGSSRAFAARVMEALPPAAHAPARGAERTPWRAWALAAAVVLCLGLGWAAGRYGPGPAAPGPTPPVAAGAGSADVRWVRLVHLPHDPDVRQVAVAGDFNGWRPETMPMQRQGDAWVAWLALPPDVYEYMFVENGERWLTDPLAVQTRADGFGGENAVLDLSL